MTRPPNLNAVRKQAEQSIKLPSHQSEWLLADAVLFLLGTSDKLHEALEADVKCMLRMGWAVSVDPRLRERYQQSKAANESARKVGPDDER